MDESEFWGRLEYRVCQELDGLGDNAIRAYWCDGFVPSEYLFGGESPRILGRAWMGKGPRDQEPWEFTLRLDRAYDSVDDIDWPALLPGPDVTRWLTADPNRKYLMMEPSAAVPDA